jgi:hypothetical protein
MKYLRSLAAGCIAMAICSSAAAFDIQQGIHGMRWGSSISEYEKLTRVKELNRAAYYLNSDMRYETANQPVPAVYYGFYNDQFFAVFIRLRSPDQFSHLERQFRKKHGEPKTTRDPAAGLTVHRWKDADVSIKLKLRESPVEYKLAIYYLPLAAALNQESLEKDAPEAGGLTPAPSDQSMNPMPLIEY